MYSVNDYARGISGLSSFNWGSGLYIQIIIRGISAYDIEKNILNNIYFINNNPRNRGHWKNDNT